MSTKVVHRFLREPNHAGDITNRIANRFNPFKNTLAVLKDPEHDRTLFLVGTTNSSTTIAQNTRRLLKKVQPDAVYVQASSKWWNYAKHSNVHNIQTQVKTQQLFSEVSKIFQDDKYHFENNPRGIYYRFLFHLWFSSFKFMTRFTEDFRPFNPGLETYYTLKYAEEKNVQTIFGGSEFDPITIQALRVEKGMYPFLIFYRGLNLYTNSLTAYSNELQDFYNVLATRGGQAFAESMDRSRANFMVAYLNKVMPIQKRILVDLRDQRILRDLYETKAKRIFAVVNQWHMEGVVTRWKRLTGTEVIKKPVSPIADMDIDGYQEMELVNDFLREFNQKKSGQEPATWQNYLTHYHEEHYEYERTRKVNHLSHEDIPEPGQTPKPKHH